GDIQITSDSTITWFSEIKTTQLTEGHMEVLCEGNVSLIQEDSFDNYEQVYLKLITTSGVVFEPSVKSFEEEKQSSQYLRGETIRAKGMEEFASKEILQGPYLAGQPASVDAEGAGDLIDITANDIDSWEEGDTRVIVALGNVKIKKGGETLDADNAILYMDLEKGEKGKSSKQTYKEIYAEGNVTLVQGSDLTIADKIFNNVKENKGLFVNSTITRILKPPVLKQATPVYIAGEEIKLKEEGRYEVENGHFSLCSYGHPHYRFKFSKLRISKSAKSSIASTRNNIFYVGKVPIMYVPFLNFDLQSKTKRLKSWDTGTTSRFGRFVNTSWDVYGFAFGEKMAPWSDLILSLDYLQFKGPRAGVDFEYGKENFTGYFNSYFMIDNDDTGINDVPVDVEKDIRGHYLWRHRLMLSQIFGDESDTNDNDNNRGWIADMEISQVSDRAYLREFFQQQLKTEKERETVFYLRKISDNKGFTFLAEHQLKPFDNESDLQRIKRTNTKSQTEQQLSAHSTLVDSERLSRRNQSLPKLKYRIIGEPLWDGKLNLTSETELSYQNRMFDRITPFRSEQQFLARGALLSAERVFDRLPARLDPKQNFRFDTNNILNAPFRILGQNFNPYIGARFTGYSESIKVDTDTGRNSGGGAPRGRLAVPIGFNTTRSLSRTYSVYNKFLNINRLRHTITPELRFDFIPVVTQDPEELNQFDGIDALDTYSSIRLGLRNRLQTKRGKPGKEKSVDVAYFDIRLNFFPGDSGLNRKKDNFIEWDLNLNLSDRVSFFSEGNEFNLGKRDDISSLQRVDILNMGLSYNHPKWGNFSIGNRFARNIISTVNFSVSKQVNKKWHVRLNEQFALPTSPTQSARLIDRIKSARESLYASANIQRLFHDWIVNISISQIGTRANDNIVFFNIVPRGIAKVKTQSHRLSDLGLLIPGSAARQEKKAQTR
ncbi:MAG: LPS-assembly protein LptD, partial [Candidatus Scalindua sp.]